MFVSYSYNDKLMHTNSFRIEKGKSIYSNEPKDFLIYDSRKLPEVILKFTQDTIVIADNNYDGYLRVYVRQKN